jgi:ubiquinone/menaquinone biosynthesis C-methylase UbiE
MGAVPSDYDSDPERWASLDPSTQRFGDVHERVAAIITAERAVPTLDVGGGDGRLEKCLPADWPSIILDNSPSQVAASANSKILADAVHLPFSHEVVGSVTMLWMLYHLDEPVRAIEESRRVLRPGGLFLACTSSRRNDPELTDGFRRRVSMRRRPARSSRRSSTTSVSKPGTPR